jgi:hypothetical protein
MYTLFVLSVHVYYVNCNAKTQMGYLCALIRYKLSLIHGLSKTKVIHSNILTLKVSI